MDRVFTIPPVFAALAFTVSESIQLMHRPDSIYIPIVFEVLLFTVSYFAFAIINAISIAPASVLIASQTSNRIAGFVFALIIAVLGSYIIYAVEFFGHKSSILHRAYVFGSFFPLFFAALSSFYFAAKHRSVMAKEPDAGS